MVSTINVYKHIWIQFRTCAYIPWYEPITRRQFKTFSDYIHTWTIASVNRALDRSHFLQFMCSLIQVIIWHWRVHSACTSFLHHTTHSLHNLIIHMQFFIESAPATLRPWKVDKDLQLIQHTRHTLRDFRLPGAIDFIQTGRLPWLIY